MVSCHPRQHLLCLIDLIYADEGDALPAGVKGRDQWLLLGFTKHYSNPKIDKLESWKL
jgi:hypothetical protein